MTPLRMLLATLLLLAAPARAQDDLVIDIADPIVEIRSFFSGAEIFVFGALDCDAPCDVIVIVEGPPSQMVVRRKERVAGIWINRSSRDFQAAPGYYAAASTKPLSDILSAEQLQRMGLGTNHVILKAPEEETETAAFRTGLISILEEQALYQNAPGAVSTRAGRLFRAAVQAPAAVPTGNFSITVHTVQDGAVTGTATQQLVVKKAGFEAFVFRATRQYPLIYAVFSVALALGIGFVSATLFARR